ncbi:glycosyltransferase [uncultured Clostridium sp.]|uniref:glycosyltransferase n=1 Tax=uncultured Clostridium sp. TaxID=59620 RepID=UPI0025F0271D|nr:glycosyltransferase [uncultured Clostridium sp.]
MVSIIIAVYNGEKYIEQAIESVLSQTYKDLELIVCDDGSTDNTRKLVQRYTNVIYIYQKHKGQGAARNSGISASKGDYIAFLDADDLYTPDKIQKQIDIFSVYKNVDIVYNDLIVTDKNLKYLNVLKSEGRFEKRQDLLAAVIFRQIIQGPICMMLRRKCTENIKWSEELKYAADYQYIIKLAQEYNFKYLEKPLYIYRRHESNLSNHHQITVEEEKNIVKELGTDKIKSIVEESTFNDDVKQFLLAKIYIKIDEYEKAEIILKLKINIKEKAILYFYLGLCNYKLNHIEEAIDNYKMSIKIDDKMCESYNNLGCCIYNRDKNVAKKCFEKALSIKKEYMDARHNLNSISAGKDNIKVTERELRKVLTLYE